MRPLSHPCPHPCPLPTLVTAALTNRPATTNKHRLPSPTHVRPADRSGGDDDRQWLTFWMIMMLFFVAERFTDVLLSRLPIYYEAKFLLIVWLMFAQGADKLYRGARQSLKKLSRIAPWLFPPRKEMSEEEYILSLPAAMRLEAAELGVRKFWERFACDGDLSAKFGAGTVVQLWNMWNKVDPRYLTIHLLSASDLPIMDVTSTDAYCIAYLVPPSPEARAKLDEEDAAATAAATAKLASMMEKRRMNERKLAISRSNTTPLPSSPGRGRSASAIAAFANSPVLSSVFSNSPVLAAIAARDSAVPKAEGADAESPPPGSSTLLGKSTLTIKAEAAADEAVKGGAGGGAGGGRGGAPSEKRSGACVHAAATVISRRRAR